MERGRSLVIQFSQRIQEYARLKCFWCGYKAGFELEYEV